MTNPTSNFGWQMPTSTDLVTDLPADFEVFGQAVDTSLADLKGGTSGQILSKATNADMDFTWITNDVGDITAVTAGTGITGGGTSGAVTVSFDQANFGGGQNAAGKNVVINGGMDIWQRGTSFTATGTFSTSYTADRWQGYQGGAGNTQVTSRQASDLPGFRYFARVQRPSGNSTTGYLGYWTTIETANSIPLAGKTVTLSFYARAGSNMTNSNALVATVNSGTGTDQPTYAFTGNATVATTTVNLVSSGGIVNGWTRYSVSGTVASTATELGVSFTYTPTGTASTNDYYDVTGVQLEISSTATPFQRSAGTIQNEFAACQRYYYRAGGSTAYQYFFNTAFLTTTTTRGVIPFPVPMRTAPTFGSSAANTFFVLSSGNTSGDSGTVVGTDNLSNTSASVNFSVGTARTAGIAANVLAANNINTYLEFNAEL
jgi:hypothetical protein